MVVQFSFPDSTAPASIEAVSLASVQASSEELEEARAVIEFDENPDKRKNNCFSHLAHWLGNAEVRSLNEEAVKARGEERRHFLDLLLVLSARQALANVNAKNVQTTTVTNSKSKHGRGGWKTYA